MKIFAALALFALWLALSASYHPAHLIVGALLAVLVVWLNRVGQSKSRSISVFSVIAYVPWLAVRIVRSGLHVSRLILHPSLPIAPRLIRHQSKLRRNGELVLLGNSITLTPGTITVEVAPGELMVHALDEASSKDLLGGELENKVGHVFRATESDS